MVDLYQHQPKAPIADSKEPDSTVSVVDPRHPFYGRTFTLLDITDHATLGRCCQVSIEEVTRLIPLQVTDLNPEQMLIYPLPINLTSLEHLINTCSDIYSQLQEGGIEEDNGNVA